MKRRKCLLGTVAMSHAVLLDLTEPRDTESPSKIDVIVKSEISKFEVITLVIAAEVCCAAPFCCPVPQLYTTLCYTVSHTSRGPRARASRRLW